MEIRHLEYFLEVARCHSFSRASESIHVSQPTLSRTVIELENELETQLFRRTNQEVLLTEAGAEFVEQAARIVREFRSLRFSMIKTPEMLRGKVYIGLPPITAATSFADVLGRFKSVYSRIHLTLFEHGPLQIEKMLREGLLDFGIFLPSDSKTYEWEWFDQDLHSVVLPVDHPLAVKESIGYRDLQDEQLIIYNADYLVHDQILSGFQQLGLTPQIGLETTQRGLMLMLVESNFGLAVLPSKVCGRLVNLHPHITARPLDDKRLKMNLALVRRRQIALSPEAELFWSFFHTHIRETGFCLQESDAE